MKPHPFETTQNPNAIEDIFCKEFDKAKRVPMDKEDSGLLIDLLSSKPILMTELDKEDKPFLVQLIEKRVEHCFSFKITDARVVLFLSVIAKSAGTAIMYLTYLQYKCKQKNITDLSLQDLCEIFPIGFVEESELQPIWVKQKVSADGKGDNLLDYQSAMKSIQFNVKEEA